MVGRDPPGAPWFTREGRRVADREIGDSAVASFTNKTISPAGLVTDGLRSSAASLAIMGYERLGEFENSRATAEWLKETFATQPETITAQAAIDRIDKSNAPQSPARWYVLLGCLIFLVLLPLAVWAIKRRQGQASK